MKFLPGNPGGPGRPRRAIEERYLRKISSSVTMNEWKEIILMAVEQAKGGDATARRWLSEYLIGRPLPLPETAKEPKDVKIVVRWEEPEKPLNIKWIDAEKDDLDEKIDENTLTWPEGNGD